MNHVDEDLLDESALGRITDKGQLADIEEHLLIFDQSAESI